jgi:putative sigma-54 modulation protein
MRLELTGRHVDITPGLRRLIDSKFTKLERVISDRAVSAQCVLTIEKRLHCAEVTLHARGEKFLHAVGTAEDGWQAAVTVSVAKLTIQAKKVKGKWQGRKRGDKGTPAALAAAADARAAAARPRDGRRERKVRRHIVEAARRPIKPMSVADAAREIEDGGDGVVIFRDLETASVNVLYRRPNGELQLVETEA